MRKIAAVLAVLLFVFSCSKKETDVLTFAAGGAPEEIAAWEEVIADFTSRTGIKVKFIRQPTDSDLRRQGLIVPLKAKKTEPDVFMMDVAWIGQFAASGWLAEITGVNTGVFFDKAVSTADIYESKLIAVPVNIDAGVLYYRSDIVKNPPESWEDLSLLAGLYIGAHPGSYGFAWQGAQYEGLVCNFLEFAGAAGGGIKIDDKAVINTPENIKALEFMMGTVKPGGISPPNTYTEMKEEETRLLFERGGVIFQRNWPYAWALHQREGSPVKGKTGIAPLPGFKGNTGVSTLGGWHAGISAHSKKLPLALKFIGHITSHETQLFFALRNGWNPSRTDVYDDSVLLKEMPHFSQLKKVFINAVSRPNVPYYTQVSAVLQRHLNSALAGSAGAEQALKEAEEEINRIIKRYE